MSPHPNRRSFLRALAGAGLARQMRGQTADRLPVFADIAPKSGIHFRCNASKTSQKYLIETMVGGVAMLDYDGDRRLDLFFVNGAALDEKMPAGNFFRPPKARWQRSLPFS